MANAASPLLGFVNGSKNLFPPKSMEETRKMIEQLCIDIDFAHKVEKLDKFVGGNNTAILFTCLPLKATTEDERVSCVLRTSLENHFRGNPPVDICMKSEVSITHYFRQKRNLPIPLVLAWDCTYQNSIKCPYSLLEQVKGETLEFEYFKLNYGLQHKTPRNARVERRCLYARCVADFVAAMDKTELPGYGFFVAPANTPHKGIKVEGDFQLSRDSIDGIRIPSEPNFLNWVNNILNAQMQRASDIFLKLSPVEVWKVQKLRQIGSQMAEKGLLTDEPAVLWHADFYPRNIMVKSPKNRATLTGVIDWDEARAFPRLVARKPPSWLWSMKESPLLPDESDTIAAAFYDHMEILRPGYKDDACMPIRKAVRALCMYAVFGVNFKHYLELSFDGLMFTDVAYMNTESQRLETVNMDPPLTRNPHVELLPLVDAPVYGGVGKDSPPEKIGKMIPFPSPLSSDCERLLNALLLQHEHPQTAAYVKSKGGGNNNLVVFTCLTSPFYALLEYCIRTPRYISFSQKRQYPICQPVKTLVALTHQFGVLGVGLPIPEILFYDSGFENPISCPYVVMQLISGTTLQKLYQTMQRSPNVFPFALQYCQLAREIAHFIAKKESVKIPGYGVLRNVTDTEIWNREDPNACYDLAVDELSLAGEKIPKFVFHQFIRELVTKETQKCINLEASGQRYQGEKLACVWAEMAMRDMLNDEDSTLWHPDFHPRNIMIVRHKSDILLSGVIDWDNSLALPRIMTREPPSFLWNQPGVLTQPEADAVKQAFDETVEQLVPGYTEDAYSRPRVLIRALGMYSLYGPKWKHYGEISFDEFLQECERFFAPDLLFPIL
ncbi:uncharacterized protein Bfra_003955 [Botrytis fragariae]|uniref:Aminoglycoside phosphotransferase domain-containing protein n=1 Tax=Botrytis fragariae TaxID=1964551 RepID=A0A8H6AXE0_9HELO|nr:uncharacterized protein Bfra_003955 [Botrytis fragariae]KAF5875501.1 hypothetical protein Bfra_003955 [Botrytis fragariae]